MCAAIEAKPKIWQKDEHLKLSVVLILPIHVSTKFNSDIIIKTLILIIKTPIK